MKTEQEMKKVEIDVKLLEKIAEFYEFPLVVFFGNMKVFPKCKTRNKILSEKAEKYDKIRELVLGEDE